jgi:hypothetical protein
MVVRGMRNSAKGHRGAPWRSGIKNGAAACRKMTTVLQGPQISHRDHGELAKIEAVVRIGRSGIGRAGRKASGNAFQKSRGITAWKSGENWSFESRKTKSPASGGKQGCGKILGSTRLSGQHRPDPASWGFRVIGGIDSLQARRTFALDRRNHRPEPHHGNLESEALAALGNDSVAKHGSANEVGIEIWMDWESVKRKIRKVYLHTQGNPHPPPCGPACRLLPWTGRGSPASLAPP